MSPSMFPLVALLCVAAVASALNPVVDTRLGPVQGVVSEDVVVFKGIPIAATTGGANRWLPPQPRAPWGPSVFNASTFGPGCYQTHHNADVPTTLSEDCLSVNVWVPANATSTSRLPVAVFWHGGSFQEGGASADFHLYSGEFFAAHYDVIVVTAQYRLGALGFAVLHGSNGEAVNGNLGLLDQSASLRWINANIAAFGGNPDHVTIWGESAGAFSVGLHLLMPASFGLFKQAVLESDFSGWRYRDLQEMGLYGDAFCKDLGCTVEKTCNLTCARTANVSSIGSAWNKAGNAIIPIVFGNWGHYLDAFLDWLPVIDGKVVPQQPYQAWASGNYAVNTTMLITSNNHEGATFIYAGVKEPIPLVAFSLALDVVFGTDAASKIRDYYTKSGVWPKDSPTVDGRPAFSQIITDYWVRCSSEKWATTAVQHHAKAFVGHFVHVLSDRSLWTRFGLPAICANVTCHAAELPFVFHASTDPEIVAQNFTFTADEVRLEDEMSRKWASFFMHGDPNALGGGTDWPVWDPTSRVSLRLQTPAPANDTSATLCSFWDTIGYDH